MRKSRLPVLALVLLAGCVVPVPGAAPTASAVPEPPPGAFMCPVDQTRSRSAVIPEQGGTLELRGHAIQVPPGHADVYHLIEPRAEYIVIEVQPDRVYAAGSMARLTISFQRCTGTPPRPPYRVLRYHDGERRWLPIRAGEAVGEGQTVSVPLESQSRYAISGG